MDKYDDDFGFSNVKREQAKLLPKGWYWTKYDDGSGCLTAPDGKEYMSYDLQTNEYQETRDSSYEYFPLSYYYADGIEPKKFRPFEYMEQVIKEKYIDKDKERNLIC